MTLGEVRELFAYNAWANRRFFAALEPLPTESYFRDLKSSHGGLHGTLCHIARRNTGTPKAAPIQNRRVMSRSSVFSSSFPAMMFFGSSAMPQIGQLPG